MNDHVVLLRAIINGTARWEPFQTQNRLMRPLVDITRKVAGTIVINGIKHPVCLDRFGCPVLTDEIRNALARGIRPQTVDFDME